MIYIKLPQRLRNLSPSNKRNVITGDESLPFTEQPHIEVPDHDKRRIAPCDLFSLFTANIIREKVVFTR